MEFKNCKVGFGKELNWEMGLVEPFRALNKEDDKDFYCRFHISGLLSLQVMINAS